MKSEGKIRAAARRARREFSDEFKAEAVRLAAERRAAGRGRQSDAGGARVGCELATISWTLGASAHCSYDARVAGSVVRQSIRRDEAVGRFAR